jgi:hypothetical protein
MSRFGLPWLGICLCSMALSAQTSLPVTQQEIADAAASRAPFLQEMQERSHRGIFPDDDLANSLTGDNSIVLAEVVSVVPRTNTNLLTLQTDEILRGEAPKIFTTGDHGGPAQASDGIFPPWGWMRIQAGEHKKYLVAVRQTGRPSRQSQPISGPSGPNPEIEYLTKGVLDLQTDEAEWLAPVRRLLALEARTKNEGPQVLVEGLKDDSQFVRTRALWKLSKLCKPDSECWIAAVDAEAELLQHGDEAKREEAINSFETLMVRTFGVTLTFEAGTGKKRLAKEMNELSPPDFSFDKDVSASALRIGTVQIRSKGPAAVYPSPSGQKVRQFLEAELSDKDLAIGDEAFSLLTLLKSGAPEFKSKCIFVLPALRRTFDYSGEVPAAWLPGIQSLSRWSVCAR